MDLNRLRTLSGLETLTEEKSPFNGADGYTDGGTMFQELISDLETAQRLIGYMMDAFGPAAKGGDKSGHDAVVDLDDRKFEEEFGKFYTHIDEARVSLDKLMKIAEIEQ
jgi:hypothetical protein